MKHSIPFGELPRTFQEALQFTGYLGLRYLWIDSLCIIQDSREDWQKESARMCHVFANSYCNIAAGAENSSVGLFSSRDPRLLQPITVRVEGIKYRVVNFEVWVQEVEWAPLNRRSWVLQERLLSPRNLHFAKEIFWECNETTSSETYPETYPDTCLENFSFVSPSITDFKKRATDCFKRTGDSQQEHIKSWTRIIKTYSRSKLTFESDKLLAIGGLAEKFQSSSNDLYLAGLWKHGLEAQLLWYAGSLSLKTEEYIAPSWSWASVNGEVGIRNGYDNLHKPLISLKSTKMEYETSNKFGQIRSGALCFYGKLFLVKSVFNGAWLDRIKGKESSQAGQKNMYGFPTLSREYDFIIEGLLLEPSGDVGQFRRVGMFNVHMSEEQASAFETIKTGMRCFDGKAKDSGLEYVDDGKGGYKYLVTLI